MHSWVVGGGLSNHDPGFVVFGLQLVKRLVGILGALGSQLVADRTEIVVVGVVDKAGGLGTESLHDLLECVLGVDSLSLALSLGLPEHIGSSLDFINFTEQFPPFDEGLVSREGSELDVLVELIY